MAKRAVAGVLVACSVMLVAGKKDKEPPPEVSLAPAAVPDLFLRSGFDRDPSGFVGQFVPTGTQDVDESNAMQLTCSKFISYKEVDAGGVTYDEVFNASTAVAVRIGIPGVVGVGGGHTQSKSVRVQYTLLKKMVSTVTDLPAFEACCKAAPDQCTDRYVSEFYEGTGQVFYKYETGSTGKGTYNVAVADLDVKNGVSWAKSINFPNPVYFAFKTKTNMYTGAQAVACGDWVNAPPKSTQGTYFVGVSDPRSTEAAARDAALANARLLTVQWAGTAISEGTMTVTAASGDRAALTEHLKDARVIETASQGVAKLVKDESWCVTQQGTPDGPQFTAKVLGFLPKESQAAAAEAIAAAAKAP